jgi:hypothetical protein
LVTVMVLRDGLGVVALVRGAPCRKTQSNLPLGIVGGGHCQAREGVVLERRPEKPECVCTLFVAVHVRVMK